jgi:HPt (histidine-containing phosphotransfer) domain-containing protein
LKITDLSYLISMADKNNELILEMIDIFIVQVEEFGIEMQRLLEKKDYDSLGKLAHKAKSTVSIMGMAGLSGVLKNLEIDCDRKVNKESYQAVVSKFRSDCGMAISELEEHRKSLLTQ